MKILELKNIVREKSEIYYFRKFKGEAIVALPSGNVTIPVTFNIETDPLGQKSIELSFPETMTYPLIPMKKALKQFIQDEDDKGSFRDL